MRWKSAASLLAFSLLLTAAAAQDAALTAPLKAVSSLPATLPPVQPPGRPAIGVALEGGGALGLAHIGVLQWLEEHHIPVDRISGTSMGSLVAAFYATDTTPAQMRALALSDAFTRVFAVQTPYSDASFRRRQDRRELPAALAVGLRHRLTLRNALLTDRGVNEFLASILSGYNREELDYDQLPIPFRCVATDLNTLESVTFSSGPLPEAIRASISIPGVFSPMQARNGHYLVDGGILDNLPTDVLKRDLRADSMIAIHLEDAPMANIDTMSIVGVLNRAFDAGIQRNVEQAERLADVVVNVPIGSFSTTDYPRADELIDTGYKAAEQNRAALLRYALDEDGWKAYLAGRASRRRPQPGALRQVRVEGPALNPEPSAVREVLADLKPLEGHPITPAATLDALRPVQSNEGIEATFETFSPAPAPGAVSGPAAPPANRAPEPDTGLLVRLSNDRPGPPYLLISPELAVATSNISRGEMTLRFIDQNLGGFGSELRANARIGYMTDLWAEYYRRLAPGGYFIEPQSGILRAPVYIWVNQKRVAERFQQNLVAGLEAGRTFSNQVQISAGWRTEDTRWSLTTGSGGGPYLNGTAQSGLLRIAIDRATAGAISPSGFRMAASAGALYHAMASDNAPLAKLSFGVTRSWRETNIFGMRGEVNSYLRSNVAEPYRFTLGGPMRLSASSFDEYRGTDTYLAGAGYLRRLAPLPTGLGQGLYGIFAYEAGEIWSPEARAILRQDGVAGLTANTPIGLFTFGVSAGDAGHRKVFLTLGRWF
ncbi:MAG: patatin-like phospholipase family protein [Terracidiphilus sp.]